jgi:multidrug efflux pump subunit AcrB
VDCHRDFALRRGAISAAGGLLPKNLPNPPTYDKSNPADWLLMSIAVTSPDLPIVKVDEYVENFLAPQISRITGVGLVDFHGQQKPAIRVQVNPAAAAAIGISLEDVRTALGIATVNSPKGTLDGPKQSLTLDTTDQIFNAATFDAVIIAYRNGAPVRVRDIGIFSRPSMPPVPPQSHLDAGAYARQGGQNGANGTGNA